MRTVVAGVIGLLLLGAIVYLTGGGVPGSTGRADLTARAEVEPSSVYDPVRAGEPLPRGFRQLLPRDGILPIYEPAFVPAADAGWEAGTLVIGLSIGGEAKAYPVSSLNRREMVIDGIAGIPVLVTW